jgi:hypothetical protein
VESSIAGKVVDSARVEGPGSRPYGWGREAVNSKLTYSGRLD